MTQPQPPDPRPVSQDPDHPVVWPRGLKIYDRCVLTIDHLWPDGSGLATVHALVGPQQAPKRYQVLVRQGLPGDTVLVHIEGIRRHRAEARILEILSPSPKRIPPRCMHFGRREITGKGCGGCVIQSLSYQDQLVAKQHFALQALQAEGLGDQAQKLLPVLGVEAPNQWFYRNKMEFSFGDYQRQGELELGLHPRGFKHDVLPLAECFLLADFVPAYLTHLVQWARAKGLRHYVGRSESGHLKQLVLRQGKRTGECLVELVTTSATHFERGGDHPPLLASEVAQEFVHLTQEFATTHGVPITSIHWTQHHTKRGEPTTAHTHHLHGKPLLWEQMHLPDGVTLDFHIHPRAFFQPNTLQAEHLYATILQVADLQGALGSRPSLGLDLYCGTGTIALALAPYIQQVVGVELRPEAVENAVQNARDNHIENATFFAGDVAEVLGSDPWKATLGDQKIDLVVVDPPRAGLSSKALGHVAQTGARVLVYVSCEPKSLARDIRKLQAHGWTLDLIQPIDMFPHTRHLEQVARLQKH